MMPKLVVQVMNRSNHSKTILINITNVAKSLHRSPLYITKYFSFELSTSMEFDEKSNFYMLNGEYHQGKLQDLLNNFIIQFVLCRFCENPETELSCKNNKICQRCYACGNQSKMNSEDHKLVKFILRNPSKIHDNQNNRYDLNTNEQEKCFSQQNNSTIDDDDFFDEDYEKFLSLFQKKKLLNQLNDLNSIEELISQSKRANIRRKIPFYIATNLFTNEILKEIDQYEILLHEICRNTEDQYTLLDGIAIFICSNEDLHKKLSNEKQISNLFYKLYDKDIVAEEVFYDWYEKESNRIVQKTIEIDIHKYANEFIHWLKTAEEINDDQNTFE
ncbi:unnamed protein product [Adineta ricciae]|uniref:Eukaryotic translation initiation factor 5 n=1 Tax=Adineta ricciae TaxID=249248 RepID=A0A816CUY3_ADIRI|nr:unnamed protein product [Adineta ricciae]